MILLIIFLLIVFSGGLSGFLKRSRSQFAEGGRG
jgi:hypothetical protein